MTFNNTLPQTAIQKQVQDLVSQILGDIPTMFAPNELAFYTLEGKNETQIRDRFAWMMQNALDQSYPGQYIVRKEWSAWESGREKVDVAVLSVGADITQIDGTEVVALIEFKAHSFLNKEQWPYAEFGKDVAKMYDMTKAQSIEKCDNADLYFIYLQSSFDHMIIDYPSAVNYPKIFNADSTVYHTHKDYLTKTAAYWAPFFAAGDFPVKTTKHYPTQHHIEYAAGTSHTAPTPAKQNIGKAFGYDGVILPMIWGPYKVN